MLTIAIDSPAGPTWPAAVLDVSELHFLKQSQSGTLVIYVWASAAHKMAGKEKRDLAISMGTTEQSGQLAPGGDTFLTQIKFSDIWGKTVAQIENFLKTKKLVFFGQILDLSTAT